MNVSTLLSLVALVLVFVSVFGVLPIWPAVLVAIVAQLAGGKL